MISMPLKRPNGTVRPSKCFSKVRFGVEYMVSVPFSLSGPALDPVGPSLFKLRDLRLHQPVASSERRARIVDNADDRARLQHGRISCPDISNCTKSGGSGLPMRHTLSP